MQAKQDSKNQEIFNAADELVYKKETVFKHKNRIQELKQNKSREKIVLKRYQKAQRKLPDSDVRTPESFVHEYLSRQRGYAKYKHLVRHFSLLETPSAVEEKRVRARVRRGADCDRPDPRRCPDAGAAEADSEVAAAAQDPLGRCARHG